MGKKIDDLRKRLKRLEKRMDAVEGPTKGKAGRASQNKKPAKSKASHAKAFSIKKGGTRIKDTPAPTTPVA